MKKYLIGLLIFVSTLSMSAPALAHRSGCHRWHSCASDSGSYVCGDTGYCSQCSNNYYCKGGSYNPGWQQAQNNTPVSVPSVSQTPSSGQPAVQSPFVGNPKTYRQLYSCLVVGNRSSMIYHLKGSGYIKKMNLKGKKCFATQEDAISAGFRKSKSY